MDKNDKVLYELGYLLVPIIPVEKLPEEVGVLKGMIESKGGFILSETEPKQRKLAYEIAQETTGSKRSKYEEAFFGSMRYELLPEEAVKLNIELRKVPTMLRFLVINLYKENKNILKEDVKPKGVGRRPKKAVSEKEIDKEIDDLLAKGGETAPLK